MRINPILYGVMVLVVFFGIILGFQAAGIWSISGKVDAGGAAIQPSAADVNSIKGWMTLDQIATTFNVPLADLLKQFELPEDTAPATAIKDLENDLFSVTNLRTWLENRNLPVEITPIAPAVPAQSPTPSAQTPALTVLATPAPTEHVAPVKTITGKTTFQEVLAWGVSKEVIQKVIGDNLPLPSAIIKDFVAGKGLEFTTIKTQLQAEVDKIK